MATDDSAKDSLDPVADLQARTTKIRTQMGGLDKIARVHARGGHTVRERIDALVDAGSFREIGTFTRSKRPEDHDVTPGDGKIGGHATIDGRPVVLWGDDVTVMQGSSSLVGARKEERLFEHALRHGTPIVHLGETGGGRVPDILGAAGITELLPLPGCLRRHQVPMATVIVGKSFGGSSFFAAMSDFTVMVRGACMAVTSPRVFEVATGEIIGFEELGGVDVHAKVTGQIDLGVDTEDEAWEAVRRWLSYLPPNAWTPAPRSTPPTATVEADPGIGAIVPQARRRGYDMRRLIARIADPASFFELRPTIGRNTTTGFCRVDGWPIGVIASNPMFEAGAMDGDACEKAIRLLVVCDSFDIPVLFLQDVPGYLVGRHVEHNRLLYRAMRFREALTLAGCPTITIVVRKAFGLAFKSMNGSGMHTDAIYAWPGAEIGFMDPDVGLNVIKPDASLEERDALAAELAEETAPYGAAGVMLLDEVIDPATTRQVLAHDLARLATRRIRPQHERRLANWSTC